MSNDAGDATEKAYDVIVKGPGLAADRKVDLPTALAVMQVVFGESPPPPTAPAGKAVQTNLPAVQRPQLVSVREFLEESGARSIPAKIAAIGRYLRDQESHHDFSRDEIRLRFRSAGEAMPANFHRDFQKAVTAGWIGEDPQSRGRFYVTRRGDEAIDRKFEGASVPAVRSRRPRRTGSGDDEGDGSEQ